MVDVDDLLGAAAARTRPITLAETRRMEVRGALGGLFPSGGFQRGITVGVDSRAGVAGSMSLALAVTGGIMAGDGCSWAAAVGFPSLGLVAAAELGVPLDRLALVAEPGERWPLVVASLLDGVDLVLLSQPARVRPPDARRLVARARERGSVLLLVEPSKRMGWPESPDVYLDVESASWQGLGAGHGNLRARRLEVSVGGRRLAGGRHRRVSLWLPGADGVVEVAAPAGMPAGKSAGAGEQERTLVSAVG